MRAAGDGGTACRQKEIEGALPDYAKEKVQTLKAGSAATRSGSLSYVEATADLLGKVQAFLAMDVYDDSRAELIETIKREGNAWSSAFAPGGSSKKQSGRAFYNALNQIQVRPLRS